jgi:hypothetical protein
MKPVLMIHEVREEMFDLPLEDYTLTFDDGLYSQFYYWDRFKKLNTQKIYFISSNIVCAGTQSEEFPACRDAHIKAFDGNYEDYMTVAQIKELMADPLVTIGAHSHAHRNLRKIHKLFDCVAHIASDTEQMINWFRDTLGFRPTSFCFPYNAQPMLFLQHLRCNWLEPFHPFEQGDFCL